MNLRLACELAHECGLETVGEAIYNVRLRVGQLFEVEEYKKLIKEYNESNYNSEDSIYIIINK